MKIPFRDKATPKLQTPDDRMTLTQHLGELRTRIIRSSTFAQNLEAMAAWYASSNR